MPSIWRILLYALITILLLLALGGSSKFLLIIAILYTLWRFIVLGMHGFGCFTCWSKLGVAAFLMFFALGATHPGILIAGLLYMWITAFTKDTKRESFYAKPNRSYGNTPRHHRIPR